MIVQLGDKKHTEKAQLGSVESYRPIRKQKNGNGDKSSDKPLEDRGLMFPWGFVNLPDCLARSREQGYLKWLQRQSPRRRVAYLQRLLGHRVHRSRASYARSNQRGQV